MKRERNAVEGEAAGQFAVVAALRAVELFAERSHSPGAVSNVAHGAFQAQLDAPRRDRRHLQRHRGVTDLLLAPHWRLAAHVVDEMETRQPLHEDRRRG